MLLGARAVGGLAAGAQQRRLHERDRARHDAAGTYRIVAVADAAGQQAELDETNDVALSAPLTVSR